MTIKYLIYKKNWKYGFLFQYNFYDDSKPRISSGKRILSGDISSKEEFDDKEIKRRKKVIREIVKGANRIRKFNPKLLEDMLKRY